jgi:hypothetical protein
MKVSAVLLLGVLLGGCCMLAAADEATWANANCDCTRERAIVCGDDGTSYLNKCWAECSGAKVAHDGACHKLAEDVAAGENIPCPCTKERAIVCGADGHSYTNACWAACAQTDVVHQGPCSRALELPPCACTTERALVCGADGHSYTNACWASCSGTSVAHDGACKKATTACDCSKERAIVCGDDGHSYLNKCWAECSGAEVAHDGACQKTALPVNADCGCHGWSRILCGADGKMYANECTMKCAGVESPGYECKPCITPRALIPTCGKDGITYYNPWELECTGVEKDHLGPCEGSDFTDDMLTSTECQKACPPVFEPVCGMNNKSYANKCRMECDGVELKHEGRCPIQTI